LYIKATSLDVGRWNYSSQPIKADHQTCSFYCNNLADCATMILLQVLVTLALLQLVQLQREGTPAPGLSLSTNKVYT